ncbi:MAG: exo-beta-N-acetylmuramidase NamZ domain-containing protein [Clostridia bacterium]
MLVKTGLEVLAREGSRLLAGKRVGLVTNHTGVDSRLKSTIDILAESSGVELTAIFGPEHGVRGETQAGEKVASVVDEKTGLPVYSLYGDTTRPTPEMLAGLDALVYDIQDVGVRFYTYVSTMAYAMQAAAAGGIEFLVLDRPNPLGGLVTEGPVLREEFASFVGVYPIPVRYGMTVGELAGLLNAEFGVGARLRVIRMEGWRRGMWFDDTGLPWVKPSPNIPTLASATVYPGTCFIEGFATVSEGRGTDRPFEWVGAPWIDGPALARRLNELRLPGVRFEARELTPAFSKNAGRVCGGVEMNVTDRAAFRPVAAGLHLVAAILDMYTEDATWAHGGSHFDRLMGTDRVRALLQEGVEASEIIASWEADLEAFQKVREGYLLYQ